VRTLLIGVAGLALLAWLALLWTAPHMRQASAARVPVAGGDAGGMARVAPLQEHIDAAALDRATHDAAAAGLQAFIVLRHGYIVYQRFGQGYDAGTVIDSGDFAQVLVALAAGIAGNDNTLALQSLNGFDADRVRDAIEAGTGQRYEQFLSLRLWRRLNAADAWIELPRPGAEAPADCCFHARAVDWLRIGALLLDDGRFEGKAVVPSGWVQRMRHPVSASGTQGFGIELPPAAHGSEPFATEQAFFLRGPERWRLWLMPTLGLGVLFGAGAGASAGWDETRLPNLVIRAISDPAPAPGRGSQLQQLVPGH
jgi:hypothetical protein